MMKIERNKTNGLDLIYESSVIETYKMDEAIDFRKLMEFLIKDELKTSFSLEKFEDNPSDPETDLINLVNEILNKYSEKVVEFQDFVKKN